MKYRKLLFKYTPKGEKSRHIGELLDLFYVPDGFFTGGEVDYYESGKERGTKGKWSAKY